ncbi:hypothetical protein [Pedobacter borealis]|uniref:hypothetical protein n=1 Tax=Pedobacter borealis TaxID=475254 RepID=UPI00068FDD3C|nr:hypothetical protein [Pedobacter borealis]
MKQIYLIVALSVMLLTSACYSIRTAGNSGKVPPGQAKKGTGSKSARPFAPGQQKKIKKENPPNLEGFFLYYTNN